MSESETGIIIKIRTDLVPRMLAIFKHAAETMWDSTTMEIIENMIAKLGEVKP